MEFLLTMFDLLKTKTKREHNSLLHLNCSEEGDRMLFPQSRLGNAQLSVRRLVETNVISPEM